jgi:ArsR family transcriptional regulator
MGTIPTKFTNIMKALSDENRLKILAMLEQGSLCACEMLTNLHIRQSTLSHHMSILSETGLVSSWSLGKWTHYRLCPEGLDLAQAFIAQLQVNATTQTLENSNHSSLNSSCTCIPEAEMSVA